MGLFIKQKKEEEPKTALGKFLKEHELEQEFAEVQMDNFQYTDYPMPLQKFRLILIDHEESLEGMYHWMITSYRQDYGYQNFHKVIDSFAASENSAFFGVTQQRLGLQQDKASQFLQGIGKMTKELFQFVRELRIIDERLEMYSDSYKPGQKTADSADISLKGIWIDLVEGGAKNPGSVYGLAREVGFATLPDLFFATRTYGRKVTNKSYKELSNKEAKNLVQSEIIDIDKKVDKLEFNRKVKEVLKRKLRTFLQWKKMTFSELLTRRRFTLQYLRQHYDIIRMYMQWIKPYLRNIRRLQLDEEKMNSADLVGAFEGSIVEVEFVAEKNLKEYGDWHAVGVVNFVATTRPAMSFQQEGYQRGPKHSGKAEITIRAYAWTKEMLEGYKKMRNEEDLDLLKTIDTSIKHAMEALGGELEDYLLEAGEKNLVQKAKQEKNIEKPNLPSVFDPFTSIFKGVDELLGAFTGDLFLKDKKKSAGSPSKGAVGDAKIACWRAFKNYRKAHKIITW
ncbi:MAG: hypothetical protein MAG795_00287 [Candidatus Woesearchaeota archaeon]|nr:hypothetical protein [Candidatus Woesearchaeota archaeon]